MLSPTGNEEVDLQWPCRDGGTWAENVVAVEISFAAEAGCIRGNVPAVGRPLSNGLNVTAVRVLTAGALY